MENALLTSWQMYYVSIQDYDRKIILDEAEYLDFYKRIQNEDRYIKINEVFYFWSKIIEFWSLKLSADFLTLLRKQEPELQEIVKKNIKNANFSYNIDSLKRDICLYLDWKESKTNLHEIKIDKDKLK